VRPEAACRSSDLGAPVTMGWHGRFEVELAFLERLHSISVGGMVEGECYLQFNVVFMRPKLTNRHTIAIFFAGSCSVKSLSLNILLVLLLLAIVSM